jgi:glycosyltransferase involved in cell wall biosynthesis
VRVLLDATSLAGSSGYRGIGTYVRNVVEGLERSGEVELVLLVSGEDPFAGRFPTLSVKRDAPPRFADLELRHRLSWDIARAVKRHGVQLFHAPAAELPVRCPVPLVATLHDVIPLVVDGYEWERRRWTKLAARFRAAAAVVAVSHYTAGEGIRMLGLDPERVAVTHLGTSPDLRCDPTTPDRGYLLFVGEYDPRKRPDLAVKVISDLKARGIVARLAVVGRIAEFFQPEWDAMVRSSGVADRLDVRGYVSQADLVTLYQGARALLVTSSIEGFGLPALEAMACGTPVIAYANSATREVVGSGGLLVPDGDDQAFADRTIELLGDDELFAALRVGALARAAEFSWASCAQGTLSAYQRALRG